MARYTASEAKKRHYTYAERTVTALSDIRERHPRSPVHLETLKAQVRRNAEAQQDLLGPRWRTGVNLACKALMDQGALDPEHPPGRIVLTPKGKQLLAYTRHSIGVTEDHEHNPECRENLGRKVIRRLQNANVKRGASSVATIGDGNVISKPLSKLTKAELIEEYQRLRKGFGAFKRGSALKIAGLTKELENKEDEMLDNYDDLPTMAELDAEVGDTTIVHEEAETEEGTASNSAEKHIRSIAMDSRTETDQQEATIDARRNANSHLDKNLQRASVSSSTGLMRTASGSYISRISKQPTPAPSDANTEPAESPPASPGQDLMEIEEAASASRANADEVDTGIDFDFDVEGPDTSFDPDVTLIQDEDGASVQKPRSNEVDVQLPTPLASPQRRARNDTEANNVNERIEALVKQMVKQKEAKIAELTAKVAERDYQIRELQAQLTHLPTLAEELNKLRMQSGAVEGQRSLQEEIDRLKLELLERSTDLESVRELLRQKDREVEENVNAIAAEKIRSEDLTKQLSDIQQQFQSSEVSRTTLKSQLDIALTGTGEMKKTLQDNVQDLDRSLTEAREHEAALTQQCIEKQNKIERQQAELQAAIERTTLARSELTGLQSQLTNELAGKERIAVELLTAQERLTAVQNLVNAMTAELRDVRRELQVERESATNLHIRFREVMAQHDELLAELEAKQVALTEAQTALTRKESELLAVQNRLNSAELATADLRTLFESAQTKAQETDARKVMLEEALRDAEEEVAELKEGYDRLKRVQLAEFEEMDRKITKKRKRASMPALLTPTTLDVDIDGVGEREVPL